MNDILATATAEQISEARNWASDCIESEHAFSDGERVSAERAVRYVERNYPGGWPAFVAECCEPEQAPQSGYTPCACRDCMDTTVSSDMGKPELCTECKHADCAPWPGEIELNEYENYECQRLDAYCA